MKNLIACFGSFAVLATAAPVESGVWRSSSDGRTADVQFSDELGGGGASGFQNGSATLLIFAIWGNDPSSLVCTDHTDPAGNTTQICVYNRSTYDYGWGVIPSSDLEFTHTSAHLETTTGPAFSSTRCTTDHSTSTPTTTCAPGPAIALDLTWDENDLYSSASDGMAQRNYGSFIHRSTGTSQTRSAFTNGTALGRDLFDAPGNLGDFRGKVVVRDMP